jgi:O-antigen ligase
VILPRVAFAASAVFLLVAPFAASGGIRATCLLVAALAIAISGGWKALLAPSAPRVALALVLAWFLLAPLSLAWTIDTRHTLEELRAESFYGVLAFAVFYCLANDVRRWKRWWMVLFAGAFIAIVAKALQTQLGLVLWRHPPDGGSGPFSTHLVLISPLLVALIARPPWGFGRSPAALATGIALLFGAAWFTREAWTTPNRIVWPALAVVFVVMIAAGRKGAIVQVETLPALRRVVAASGIAIAIAFVASIAAKNERFYRDDPGFAASMERDLRPRLWSVGWSEWCAAPLLGHGFGREILAARFLPETPVGVDHPPVRHAHNALLNIALQLGAVGLLLFMAVLLTFARNYAALLSRPAASTLGAIGLALLAGFLAKNLTDDFLHRHNAQVFWALNGLLTGFAASSRRD